MSEMVERVAIAIRRHKFERTGRGKVFDPSICTENELGEARAAIKAMMEPTDEMLSESGIFITDNARVAWQAMIQSALQSASSQSPTLEKL